MPGALVAEHDLVRIGGGKLEVAEPLAFAEDFFDFAGGEVDGEDDLGRALADGHEAVVEGEVFGFGVGHGRAVGPVRGVVALKGGIGAGGVGLAGGGVGRAGGRAVGCAAGSIAALAVDAEHEGFVGVDGGDAAAGEFGDLAGFLRGEVRGEDADFGRGRWGGGRRRGGGGGIARGALGVVNVAGFFADHNDVHAAGDDGLDRAGGEVDGRDAGGGGDDEFFAVGGVGVLVEVERSAAGLRGQADDAVAGVGVDPVGGWFGGGGGGEEGGEQGGQDGRDEKGMGSGAHGWGDRRAGRRPRPTF